jgi:hypothetical protein
MREITQRERKQGRALPPTAGPNAIHRTTPHFIGGVRNIIKRAAIPAFESLAHCTGSQKVLKRFQAYQRFPN